MLGNLHVHEEAREVGALLQFRQPLQHPREDRVDDPRVAVEQRLLEGLLVQRIFEVEHLEEVRHPIGRRVGRLIAQVDLVLGREHRHDGIDDLEELEGRLLVKGDKREPHVERRLIQPLDDELLGRHG